MIKFCQRHLCFYIMKKLCSFAIFLNKHDQLMDKLLSWMFIDPFFEEAWIFFNKFGQATIGIWNILFYYSIDYNLISLAKGNFFETAVENLETHVNLSEFSLLFFTRIKNIEFNISQLLSNPSIKSSLIFVTCQRFFYIVNLLLIEKIKVMF